MGRGAGLWRRAACGAAFELPAAGRCGVVPGPMAGEALGDCGCGRHSCWIVLVSVAAPKKLATAAEAAMPAASPACAGYVAALVGRCCAARTLAAGQPVFVDFTASWCLSCQVNERVALDQPQVIQAFQAAHVVLLKADWTRQDPAITETLAALGRSGVPVYALYTPGQSDPELLPQVLTPGIVMNALSTTAAAHNSGQR